MQVQVLFFGVLKELAGKAGEEMNLRPGATVGDLLKVYESKAPKMKDALASLAVAVNRQYASPKTELKENDEVALLPPVSGGAGGETSNTQPAPPQHHTAIVRKPIDTSGLLGAIKCDEDGAAVTFEGVVRNQTRGRKTLYLVYEAYEEMALQQMEQLVEQALKQFQIRDVALVHRLGRLEIGETSVLIVVASAHRAAAFEACRWLIDTLKQTVPIWKQEYFEDGAVWANGEPFPDEVRVNLSPTGSPEAEDASN